MISVNGKVILNDTIQYSDYFWGPMSEIEGTTLDLLEQNEEGACLCIVRVGDEIKGLMDVDPRDIKRVTVNDSTRFAKGWLTVLADLLEGHRI